MRQLGNLSITMASHKHCAAWNQRQLHDDDIKWKHFPRYWPFVRGIHRSTVNFPSQRPVTRSFDGFFYLCLNKQLSKQWWGWWFETSWCSLWRHPNDQPLCCMLILRILTVILRIISLRVKWGIGIFSQDKNIYGGKTHAVSVLVGVSE